MSSIHLCSIKTSTRPVLALVAACALASPCALAGESSGYLFDLDAPTILGIMDHYHGPGRYDERAILAHMSAPLDCRRHEVLCSELGTDYTQIVLQHAWTQAARGERLETIEASVIELADILTERWVELTYPNGIDPRSPYFGEEENGGECTETVVHSDAGEYRLRQAAHVVDLGVLPTRWARSAFQRRNSNGNYRGERADKISLEVQFFGLSDLGPHVFWEFKEKTREKAIAKSAVGTADLGTFHVEGCGTVSGPASLQACACTGERPAVYTGF